MEKVKIGYDSASYKYWTEKENAVKDAYNEILDLAVKALGSNDLISNHSEVLNAPYEYTLNVFWETYCKNEPQHINKETLFASKTGITKAQFNALDSAYKKALKEMTQHCPTVSKNGLKSNLDKENFNIYLNPVKEEEYNAVSAFMEAASVLTEKYNGTGGYQLVRMHESILMENNGPVINPNYYKL